MCVDEAAKNQVAQDNNAAKDRWDNKAKSVYGPNTCKPGYVWRFADMFDYVCVDKQTRDDVVKVDNLAR